MQKVRSMYLSNNKVEVNKEVDELMNKVVIDCMKENFTSYLERGK